MKLKKAIKRRSKVLRKRLKKLRRHNSRLDLATAYLTGAIEDSKYFDKIWDKAYR